MSQIRILPLKERDIPLITKWARLEGFAPGSGDLGIYRNTDSQGLWVAWLRSDPIGCIAGVRYNSKYGFIGLYLVVKEQRGNGFGIQLWNHAMNHLSDIPCIGLEAAIDRVDDYAKWGFTYSSPTTRWQLVGNNNIIGDISELDDQSGRILIVEGNNIPSTIVQEYDSKREPSPRPHFLFDWLAHPAGKVLALVDSKNICHGFGRIRPCLLKEGTGWRVGPLLANTPVLAELLLRNLVKSHPGIILIDSPGLNPFVSKMLTSLGFKSISKTIRMYRGKQPPITMQEVYGLACLELG